MNAPPWLREVPAVAILRRVWMQNYWWDGTQLQWREADNIHPAADGAAAPKIHAALQQRGLLPGTHIVDTDFLDAQLLVESRDHYHVDLLGPTRLDFHWQVRQGTGFDAQHFQIDWDQHNAICPVCKISSGWTPALDNRGNPVIKVKFATKDCRRCEQVTQCIRSTKPYPQRTLTIRPQPYDQALQAAR